MSRGAAPAEETKQGEPAVDAVLAVHVPDDDLALVAARRGEHAVAAEGDGVELADLPVQGPRLLQSLGVPESGLTVARHRHEEPPGRVDGEAFEIGPSRTGYLADWSAGFGIPDGDLLFVPDDQPHPIQGKRHLQAEEG